MALGTNIFYYKEDTLTNLQGLAPFTDPLEWGHFVRDITNDADYWIQPGTGALVARLAGASYSGFSFFDGVTDSGTVENGEQVLLGSTDSITLNTIDAAGTPTITAEIRNIEGATQGHLLAVGASATVDYIDPDTIKSVVTIRDSIGGSSPLNDGDSLFFLPGGGIVPLLTTSGNDTIQITPQLEGWDAATAGQIITKGSSGQIDYINRLTIAAGSSSFLSLSASNELSVSNLLITSVTENASASLAAFVASEYTLGTEFQEGDLIILTTPTETYIHNGGSAGTVADFTRINNPAGAIQSFTLSGNGGTPSSITDGDTLSINGDNVNIVSTASTDTITLALSGSIADIANTAQPGTAGSYILQYNQGSDTYSYELLNTVSDTSLSDTDQTLTGNRLVDQAANVLTFQMTGGNVVMDSGNVNVTLGDLEIETATSGVILTSANSNRYRITVNNIGALTTTLVV